MLAFLRLLTILVLVPLATSSAALASEQPPAGAGHGWKNPPLRFKSVDPFLDSIGIEEEAAAAIDPFWQPAIEALVAANPDRADAARSFAVARRAAEMGQYRPTLATMLDRRALELLHPEVVALRSGLYRRTMAGHSAVGELSENERKVYAGELARIQDGPARSVDAELIALAELARSEDGKALRKLIRDGYYWCAPSSRAAPPPECKALEKSPALRRLRKTELGEKLISMQSATYGGLMALVALSHDPGISLHQLLPPEVVRKAGLAIGDNLSYEQLVARSSSSKGLIP